MAPVAWHEAHMPLITTLGLCLSFDLFEPFFLHLHFKTPMNILYSALLNICPIKPPFFWKKFFSLSPVVIVKSGIGLSKNRSQDGMEESKIGSIIRNGERACMFYKDQDSLNCRERQRPVNIRKNTTGMERCAEIHQGK